MNARTSCWRKSTRSFRCSCAGYDANAGTDDRTHQHWAKHPLILILCDLTVVIADFSGMKDGTKAKGSASHAAHCLFCYTKSSRIGVKISSRMPASVQVQPCSTPSSFRPDLKQKSPTKLPPAAPPGIPFPHTMPCRYSAFRRSLSAAIPQDRHSELRQTFYS